MYKIDDKYLSNLDTMKLYLALNMNDTKDIKIFKERDNTILTELNRRGYNIYQSINSFYDQRRITRNIKEFSWFWIDLDYPIWEKEKKQEVIKRIKKILWVFPTKINETFKWYHIFFTLSTELRRLTLESYREGYKKINLLLSGDPKMKDVTGILKLEGYFDKKKWRDDFMITTVFSNPNSFITREVLEWLWVNVKLLSKKEIIKREKKKKEYSIRKFRNEKDIEDIDWLEFIEMINILSREEEEGFNEEVELLKTWNSYSVVGTDGIKLLKDNTWKYKIKDFVEKYRYWNKYFFLNWYLKDIKSISKKYVYFNKILKKLNSGISLWLWGDKYSFSKIWALEIINNTVRREKPWIKVFITNSSEFEQINRLIRDANLVDIQVWQIYKVLIALLKFSTVNKLYLKDEIIISEKELIEYIWLSVSKYNKEILRKILIDMSRLVYSEKIQVNDYLEENSFNPRIKHYFDITVYFWKKTKKILYLIKSSQPTNGGIIYLNESLLSLDKWLSDTRKTELGVKIILAIRNFKTYNLTLQEFSNILKLSFKDEVQLRSKLVEFLKKLKKEKLITWYKKLTANSFKLW